MDVASVIVFGYLALSVLYTLLWWGEKQHPGQHSKPRRKAHKRRKPVLWNTAVAKPVGRAPEGWRPTSIGVGVWYTDPEEEITEEIGERINGDRWWN